MFGGASKPLASLSSGLLARKGAARPAMRPQGYAALGTVTPPSADDLGWNDMGAPEPTPPAPVAEVVEAPQQPAPVPPVLVEREALKEEIETPKPVRPVSVATASRLARESAQQTKKGKAAFTLRLDADRHLRLRLASAVTHKSAQALVTAAVDELLRTIPEVELLVTQLPPAKNSTR